MKDKQGLLNIWAKTVGNAIYDTLVKSAKSIDDNDSSKDHMGDLLDYGRVSYFDEE